MTITGAKGIAIFLIVSFPLVCSVTCAVQYFVLLYEGNRFRKNIADCTKPECDYYHQRDYNQAPKTSRKPETKKQRKDTHRRKSHTQQKKAFFILAEYETFADVCVFSLVLSLGVSMMFYKNHQLACLLLTTSTKPILRVPTHVSKRYTTLYT